MLECVCICMCVYVCIIRASISLRFILFFFYFNFKPKHTELHTWIFSKFVEDLDESDINVTIIRKCGWWWNWSTEQFLVWFIVWMWPKRNAVEQKKNGNISACAPLPVYIYCGTTHHTAEMRLLTLGYLIFVDILQRSSKTGFAVEVILLPTVKKKHVYRYRYI